MGAGVKGHGCWIRFIVRVWNRDRADRDEEKDRVGFRIFGGMECDGCARHLEPHTGFPSIL